MHRLRTRVFELAAAHGYANDAELADAMGISGAQVSRVRNGQRDVGQTFIIGALRAFPKLSQGDLFYVESLEPAAAVA